MKLLVPFAAVLASVLCATCVGRAETARTTFAQTPETKLPARFDVCAVPFGAIGDGIANDRAAIQAAIDVANARGGGEVVLKEGRTFLSGTVELRSGVSLRIESNAILKSSMNPADYPYPVEFGRRFPDSVIMWDAKSDWNYPLIYAGPGVSNVAVRGPGTIETGETKDAGDDRQIFFCPIGFYRVIGFEIAEVKFRRTKGYNVSLHACSNGIVRSLNIADPYNGSDANCDGVSIEGCQDIAVRGCKIEANDDMIYVWSSWRDPRGRSWWNSNEPHPVKNILIESNSCSIVARSRGIGCHGFVIIAWGGSCPDREAVAVQDVTVRNNTFIAPHPVGVLIDDPYFNDRSHPPIRRITIEGNRLRHFLGNSPYNLRGARIENFVEKENVQITSDENGGAQK